MKRILSILMVVLLIIMMVSCGNNNEASNENGSSRLTKSTSYGSNNDSDMEWDMAENEMAMEPTVGAMNDVSLTFSENTTSYTAAETPDPQMANRKIIKSASMEMETLEYELTVQKLQDKIASMGGYIESSNVRGKSLDNDYSTRSAYYTIRIPEKNFLNFMTDMNNIGNVISQSTYGEDITSAYFDTEAHVKTLTIQEERLLEILKKAEVIEDVIELERELSNVRYQIESLSGTIRRWDNLVSYSTLNVSVYEVFEITEKVEPPKTLSDKISTAFSDSWDSIKEFFEDTTINGLGATPYLIFIIPGLIIVLIIFKKIKRGFNSYKKVEIPTINIEEETKE